MGADVGGVEIERATKQEHSGKFFNETIDKIHPW